MKEREHLTLEYFLMKGLTFQEACMTLEAVCSCAIENPRCADKSTVDKVIADILKERDEQPND